jgi:hypothetical protein
MQVDNAQQFIDEIAEYFGNYKVTYEQHFPPERRTEILLQDALYGISRALGVEYQFSNGFEKFKNELAKILIQEKLDD